LSACGDREDRLAFGRLKRKHQHLAQETPGELARQRRRRQQVRQADAGHLEESGDLVGEIIGRQVGLSPQLVQRALVLGLRSSVQRIAVARKMILAAKVVRELMRKINRHRVATFRSAKPTGAKIPKVEARFPVGCKSRKNSGFAATKSHQRYSARCLDYEL
jgi:hypothetical protein